MNPKISLLTLLFLLVSTVSTFNITCEELNPNKCNGTKPEISRFFLDKQVPVVAVDKALSDLLIYITCDFDFKCPEYQGPKASINSAFAVDIRDGLNICEDGISNALSTPVQGLGPNIERFILSKTVSLQSPAKFTYTCALKRNGCNCSDPRFTNSKTTQLIVTTKPLDIVEMPPRSITVDLSGDEVTSLTATVETVEGYTSNISLDLNEERFSNILTHKQSIDFLNETHVLFNVSIRGLPSTYFPKDENVSMQWSFKLFKMEYQSEGITKATTFLLIRASPPTPPLNSEEITVIIVVFSVVALVLPPILLSICLYGIRQAYRKNNRMFFVRLSDVGALLKKLEVEFSKSQMLYHVDNLELSHTLGEGAFGQVRKGVLTKDKGTTVDVAVKMLKGTPTYDATQEFIQEFRMLHRLERHNNIVSLVGGVICDESLYILVEYASRGSLLSLLKQSSLHRDALSWQTRLDYSLQIARGMAYLSKMNYVHCDLAARNVLISEDGTLKVSDFGLARKLYFTVYQKNVNSKTRLPIKWMAIESLQGYEFSTQSDIWSFGVLMWEIATLGHVPYTGIPPRDVPAKLMSGYRMERPLGCPETIYTIMRSCWLPKPEERPTFSQMIALLEMLNEDLDQDLTCGNFYQEYHSYQNYRPDDYGVDYTIYCCQHCHYEYDIFSDEEQVMNPKVFDPESGSECLSCPYCGHQLSEGSCLSYSNTITTDLQTTSDNVTKAAATRLTSIDSYVCQNFKPSTSTDHDVVSCSSEQSCELGYAPCTKWQFSDSDLKGARVIPVSYGRTKNESILETDI